MKAFEFFSAKRQQFVQRAQAAFAQYKEAKKQRGMTLLEVIIVLGIIGTIAAGVVVLAQRAFDSRTISEVVQATNTIRVAVKDAYSTSGAYPDYKSPLNLNNDTILTSDAGATSTLVKLGKVSVSEMRNKISGDFYGIGAGKTSNGQTKGNMKGYVIEVNGLTSEQCRSVISQVGNNWDYVKVSNAAAGAYTITDAGEDMTVDVRGEGNTSVLRSLGANGTTNITPEKIVSVCTQPGAQNSIILGSR
ncbi:type IV pilus major pilin [Vibrio cholerae]|uniref:type IV pilus major pilin n=1 Tax=Vibrio cholerae TaxID=666 RepID=UPI0022F3491C|nr:type IV pilus major pilin [Vibrio cholerae]MDA5313193.1 type IV pilus major pilin [Vibrio cholerae]MDN6972332.1 type IV pilus major pilin [Vibrio cholerae]